MNREKTQDNIDVERNKSIKKKVFKKFTKKLGLAEWLKW
jgi:hypothetical protein